MFIYNVTSKVSATIAEEWLRWMQEEHMPSIIETGCFFKYRLLRLLEQDESEGPTYAAQYHCHSMADYTDYVNNFSDAKKQEGRQKFGNGYASFRTVMEVV